MEGFWAVGLLAVACSGGGGGLGWAGGFSHRLQPARACLSNVVLSVCGSDSRGACVCVCRLVGPLPASLLFFGRPRPAGEVDEWACGGMGQWPAAPTLCCSLLCVLVSVSVSARVSRRGPHAACFQLRDATYYI